LNKYFQCQTLGFKLFNLQNCKKIGPTSSNTRISHELNQKLLGCLLLISTNKFESRCRGQRNQQQQEIKKMDLQRARLDIVGIIYKVDNGLWWLLFNVSSHFNIKSSNTKCNNSKLTIVRLLNATILGIRVTLQQSTKNTMEALRHCTLGR